MPLDAPISLLPAWTGSTANNAADLLAIVNNAITKKITVDQLFLQYGITTLPTGVNTPIANGNTIAVMMANLQAQINNKYATRVLYANTTTASGTNGPAPYGVNTYAITKSASLVLPVTALGQKIKIKALARYLGEPGSTGVKCPTAAVLIGGIQVGGFSSPIYPVVFPTVATVDSYSRLTGYEDVALSLETELTLENLALGIARFNGVTKITGTGREPDSGYTFFSDLRYEDYMISISLSDNTGIYFNPFTYNLNTYPSVTIEVKVGDMGEEVKWYIHHLSVEFIDK